MELRCRSSIHFIQAIKNGTVVKTSTLESPRKPNIVFKALKDIYEGAELVDLGVSSKLKWKDRYRELAFDVDAVKIESPCVPLVERKTRESDYGDNEDNDESDDLNFANTTLKQIKERCKTKKRKGLDCFGLSPKQECTKLEPEEDEFDLMEPLCILKSRIVKSPKSKKKCREKSVSPSPKILVPVKAEPIMVDGDFVQCTGDFSTITVKAEDPLPEYSENHIIGFGTGDSNICIEQVKFGEVFEDFNCESQNVKPIFVTEQCGSCVVNSLSYEHLEPIHDNTMEVVKGFNREPQNVNPISITEQYESCVVSSLSYEHLEPVHDDTMEVDNQGRMEQDLSDLNVSQFEEGFVKHSSSNDNFNEVVSPNKDQRSDTCNIAQICSDSEVQVSIRSINNGGSHGRGEPTKDLPSSNLCSSLSCENGVVSKGDLQSPALGTTGKARTCSYSDNKFIVASDDCLMNEENTQSQSFVGFNAKKSFFTDDNTISDLSTSEVWHLPERLPSTRKAIAPTSEERLCLAMNSMEAENDIDHDIDHNKCKGTVLFGENDKASSDLTVSPQKHEQVVRTKSTSTRLKEILKKPKKFKKGSPPKGGLEGSRSFPRFSTGCTSIQACSESAIAFSQRQMHDIEHLATKLMAELKSVKEIVEEKLLFEAYRSPSLKNDADEVKNVIKNATRVELTSKRWLSLMARDCNRFCKIMKLKDNEAATPSPENPSKKEKKITFADEAGGTLCQVKLFENYVDSSTESKSETHELQAE